MIWRREENVTPGQELNLDPLTTQPTSHSYLKSVELVNKENELKLLP
jgi:hypothetical protein